MALLRLAIRVDASGTGLLGIANAAFANPLARLTGLTPLQAYVTAAAFVFSGFAGNLLARRPRIRRIGTGLSAANLVGTLAAVVIAVTAFLPLTGAGRALVLACGVYTLFFGIMQLIGARRILAVWH